DDPADIIDTMVLGGFVAGTQPFARAARLQRVRADAPLIPEGIVPTRVARDGGFHSRLAAGDGWVLQAERWTDGLAYVLVVAVSEDRARSVLDDATKGAVEEDDRGDEATEISFWHFRQCGSGRRVGRSVDTPSWNEIRGNYPGAAAGALDNLMGV